MIDVRVHHRFSGCEPRRVPMATTVGHFVCRGGVLRVSDATVVGKPVRSVLDIPETPFAVQVDVARAAAAP
jgi:hypothetical protein